MPAPSACEANDLAVRACERSASGAGKAVPNRAAGELGSIVRRRLKRRPEEHTPRSDRVLGDAAVLRQKLAEGSAERLRLERTGHEFRFHAAFGHRRAFCGASSSSASARRAPTRTSCSGRASTWVTASGGVTRLGFPGYAKKAIAGFAPARITCRTPSRDFRARSTTYGMRSTGTRPRPRGHARNLRRRPQFHARHVRDSVRGGEPAVIERGALE